MAWEAVPVHLKLPASSPRINSTPMKLPHILSLFSICSLAALAQAEETKPAPAAEKPNILFILADDLGYRDIGCHGGKIPTPHIDSLAKNGMSFDQAYVTAPQCAPSRAGLLTGRYQQRFGFEYNLENPKGVEEPGAGIAVGEKTVADALRAAGYHTGIIGKWHLGVEPQFHPLEHGFDEFFGFLNGSSHYQMPDGRPIPGIMRDRKPAKVTSYLTDVLGEEAVSFIERNKNAPWFLYLAFTAPHEPWEASEKHLAKFSDVSDAPLQYPGRGCPNERTYAAMVSALDDAIGNVLAALKANHLDKRTLVVFLSDNGSPLCVTAPGSNDPLRGEKGDVLEGGIRVPFLAEWPGRIPADVKIHAPVSSLDLFPTFLAAAGAPPAADLSLDGENLLPVLLSGKELSGTRTLYWLFRLSENDKLHSWGIREGDLKYWRGPVRFTEGKLFRYPDMAHSPQTALFNIEKDIHEDSDLSAASPEKRSQLVEKLRAWMKELKPAAWGPSAGKPLPSDLE
jgi:arylsulfatase A-like enzyme